MKKPVRGKIELAGEMVFTEEQVSAPIASDKTELTEVELSKNKSLKMLFDVPKRIDAPREISEYLKRRFTVEGIIENYRSKAEELLSAGSLDRGRAEDVATLLRRLDYLEAAIAEGRTSDAVINAFWAGQLTRTIDMLEFARMGFIAQGGRRGGGARQKKCPHFEQLIERMCTNYPDEGWPSILRRLQSDEFGFVVGDCEIAYNETSGKFECLSKDDERPISSRSPSSLKRYFDNLKKK